MPAAVVKQIPRRTRSGLGGPKTGGNPSRKRPTRTTSHKFRAQDFVRRRRNEKITDHYALGKLLGDGQFGEVFMATTKMGNDPRAIKKIHKELMEKEDHQEVFHEFTTLKQMDHVSTTKTIYSLYILYY